MDVVLGLQICGDLLWQQQKTATAISHLPKQFLNMPLSFYLRAFA